jgi:hypothetical protein
MARDGNLTPGPSPVGEGRQSGGQAIGATSVEVVVVSTLGSEEPEHGDDTGRSGLKSARTPTIQPDFV